MKRNITKKTVTLANQLQDDYKIVYEALIKQVEDKDYTRSEINYFLRKTIIEMSNAMTTKTNVQDFTSHNEKKYLIEVNKQYREWHKIYDERMKQCDHIIYSCYLSVIFYFFTLVAISAFMADAISNWLWMILPGILTIFFMVRKIMLSRKLKLSLVHSYGDIIMFALVSILCVLSNYYFMIFLWIYDVMFMIYLQKHIVEEDL